VLSQYCPGGGTEEDHEYRSEDSRSPAEIRTQLSRIQVNNVTVALTCSVHCYAEGLLVPVKCKFEAFGPNCLYTLACLFSFFRGSSVSTVTDCGLGDLGSIPCKDKDILFSTVFRSALGTTQSPIEWALRSLYPRVKRPQRESDHSLSSTAEVIRMCEATPLLPHTFSWRDA
jgi:hypothetical protein